MKEIGTKYSALSESAREKLVSLINSPGNVLIMSHKNPDGDAVGSALGLGRVLESLGHKVKVFLPDDGPDFLKWLPDYEKAGIFERSPKKFHGLSSDPDLVFFVDFNTPERLGDMADSLIELGGFKVLVDHHPGQVPFYDLAIVDTSKGSTCELIFLLLEDLGMINLLDKEAATCLYTGIITDTLGLQVSSSYAEVFRVVGKLVELGVDMNAVYNQVYHQYSASRMKLLGYCLAEKMKLMPEYKVAYIWITKSELNRFHHLKGDTEGFVNYPLSIKNIEFTVLFTELEGEIKLSLRSKGNIPVNEFANQYFNGGGHRNAAGGRSGEDMQNTIDYFETNVKLFMSSLLAKKHNQA